MQIKVANQCNHDQVLKYESLNLQMKRERRQKRLLMRLFSKRLTGAICAISKIFVKRWIDAIFVKISLRKSLIREFRRIWALPFVFCFLVFFCFFWGGSKCLPGWFGALIKRRIVQFQIGICLFLGGLNPCQDGLGHLSSEN